MEKHSELAEQKQSLSDEIKRKTIVVKASEAMHRAGDIQKTPIDHDEKFCKDFIKDLHNWT